MAQTNANVDSGGTTDTRATAWGTDDDDMATSEVDASTRSLPRTPFASRIGTAVLAATVATSPIGVYHHREDMRRLLTSSLMMVDYGRQRRRLSVAEAAQIADSILCDIEQQLRNGRRADYEELTAIFGEDFLDFE